MNNRKKGFLLLLAAAFLWSLGGMLMKLVSWNGFAVGGCRSLISALFIFPFVKKWDLKFTKWRIVAIVSYCFTVIVFAVANKLTTSANAIMLQYTAPIYAAVLGAILVNEKIKTRDVISIIIVLIGMVIFVAEGLQGGHILGDTLALLSGITFALVSVTLRMEKDNDPTQIIFFGNLLGFFVSLPFMRNVTFTGQNIIGILILGTLQLGLSYVFYTHGMKYVTALEGVVIPMLEPILNPVWVMLIVGERPAKLAIIGGMIIIFGVFIRELARIYENKKSPSIN